MIRTTAVLLSLVLTTGIFGSEVSSEQVDPSLTTVEYVAGKEKLEPATIRRGVGFETGDLRSNHIVRFSVSSENRIVAKEIELQTSQPEPTPRGATDTRRTPLTAVGVWL